MIRKALLACLAALSLTAAEPWEKLVGTWRAMPAKPRILTMKVGKSDAGLTYVVCRSGEPCKQPLVFRYDGTKFAVHDGSPGVSHRSFRRTSSLAAEMLEWGDGGSTLLSTTVFTISPDGKTMTADMQSEMAPSLKVTYTRQGAETSFSEPFVGDWITDVAKLADSEELTAVRTSAGVVIRTTVLPDLRIEHIFDGKDRPLPGTSATFACRVAGDNKLEVVTKQNGAPIQVETTRFSDDGRTMHVVWRSADGSKVLDDRSYEKIR